jgi:hypothetical protein
MPDDDKLEMELALQNKFQQQAIHDYKGRHKKAFGR